MAERIIDPLEVVKIEKHQRDSRLFALGRGQ